MRYHDFQRIAEQWKKHLVPDDALSFDELLVKSKSNERLRNVLAVYSLKSEETLNDFYKLALEDAQIKQMLVDLHYMLLAPGVSPSSLRSLARMLRFQPAYDKVARMAEAEAPRKDVGKEMAKVLQSMVRQYYLEHEHNAERKAYVQRKLEQYKRAQAARAKSKAK
ncbi:hypothetical protein [Aneurinibacillus terranovensis]|uniref:hypothetical protein n=1 Tax=Aneurinibacillus terranovensis TaxID=278991 RepID=UPI00040C2E1C|nr:hypothetical protein [Aneurinibacillus terranovensis]